MVCVRFFFMYSILQVSFKFSNEAVNKKQKIKLQYFPTKTLASFRSILKKFMIDVNRDKFQ